MALRVAHRANLTAEAPQHILALRNDQLDHWFQLFVILFPLR
jgi:hypothetical protein